MNSRNRDRKFICDRMVGSLCKYLRFMGYDCVSANDLPSGNPREDTEILHISESEDRLILTLDAELARRGYQTAIRLNSSDLSLQIQQLINAQMIVPEIRLTRCSCCNALLQNGPAPFTSEDQVPDDLPLVYCPVCKRQYWEGTHTRNMRKNLERMVSGNDNDLNTERDGV